MKILKKRKQKKKSACCSACLPDILCLTGPHGLLGLPLKKLAFWNCGTLTKGLFWAAYGKPLKGDSIGIRLAPKVSNFIPDKRLAVGLAGNVGKALGLKAIGCCVCARGNEGNTGDAGPAKGAVGKENAGNNPLGNA